MAGEINASNLKDDCEELSAQIRLAFGDWKKSDQVRYDLTHFNEMDDELEDIYEVFLKYDWDSPEYLQALEQYHFEWVICLFSNQVFTYLLPFIMLQVLETVIGSREEFSSDCIETVIDCIASTSANNQDPELDIELKAFSSAQRKCLVHFLLFYQSWIWDEEPGKQSRIDQIIELIEGKPKLNA